MHPAFPLLFLKSQGPARVPSCGFAEGASTVACVTPAFAREKKKSRLAETAKAVFPPPNMCSRLTDPYKQLSGLQRRARAQFGQVMEAVTQRTTFPPIKQKNRGCNKTNSNLFYEVRTNKPVPLDYTGYFSHRG